MVRDLPGNIFIFLSKMDWATISVISQNWGFCSKLYHDKALIYFFSFLTGWHAWWDVLHSRWRVWIPPTLCCLHSNSSSSRGRQATRGGASISVSLGSSGLKITDSNEVFGCWIESHFGGSVRNWDSGASEIERLVSIGLLFFFF